VSLATTGCYRHKEYGVVMKNICPTCNQPSNIGWYKATLSPLASIPCKNCECELTVSWKNYILTILPASAWFLVGYLLTEESTMEQYLVIGSSILLMTISQMLFMPIELAVTERND
jgi:hypothetical protein